MIFQHRIVLILLFLLSNVHCCEAVIPSIEVVGKLLGFPSSELVIEDVTTQERTLAETPSRREQRTQTVLPNSAILLKAYIIRGKKADTFFPIQIYIGEKDAFLTQEVLVQIDKFMKGSRVKSPSWLAGFESLGRGGMYFNTRHKVASEIPPLKRPSDVAASIFVVQPHGHNFDVKIAIRAALSQGADLEPIPGGEAYYNNFGPLAEQKEGANLEVGQIFLDLNKIVSAEWLAEKGSNDVAPPAQLLSTQQTTPSKPPVVAPQTEPLSTPSSSALRWWLGGLALVVLAFIADALRKRRR